ncbi:MAG: Methionine-tRNA ligase [Berkelbacteria bacterium GW2011_GWA2_35_9]|uniref:methionine--tRNA ligase n=1 Tax=Berkelbacteria bacterium GW2011_GWA2_35_9 TaxID=1618333 RepID=A0A0G0DJJ2_9BACT|nr:MAG: Methionine-tRNA ligase [Berkelbacteria bacterium GW2011_GWA2_35_9]
MNKFYITTPIYYVNASPHIGHAYTTIAADILCRAHKSWGEKVFFLTGTDEHGAKIQRSALDFGEQRLKIKDKKHNFPDASVGIPTSDTIGSSEKIQNYTDKISHEFKNAWKLLNINYDYFVRTTDENHERFVQEFLTKLYSKGDIYQGIYEGLYCVGCEEYKKAEDLENGNCPIHKKPVENVKEAVYFFKLSQYQDKIIQLIESDEVKIRPLERKNEVLGFLQNKLEDTAISRSKVEWGIPVPWDKEQTIYVWVDALLNYLSVIQNPKSEIRNPKHKEFWSPDLQLIGKDILRFHGVTWLGLLLSAELELPKELFAHGFFTINKQKMSKSLGNIISIQELINKYGLDATRYLLISSFPFGNDGDFSFEELDRRYESELANELGNLVQRTVVLAKKFTIKFNPENPDYCRNG